MAEVKPENILLRVGGKTLARFGVLAIGSAGRGRAVPVPYTFTRASKRRYVDRDSVGRIAANDKLALQWVDIDGDGIRETPGVLLEGARTQLVTNPENFGAWTVSGTPVLTSGQADPFGGTAAYLIEDNDGAANEFIFENTTFTGDAIKGAAIFVRAGTATTTVVKLRDTTAAADRLRISIAWSAGVPTPTASVGTVLATEPWGGGWYRILVQMTSVTATNTNRWELYPASDTTSATGTTYFFGTNAWNAVFPSSYQGPGESAGAADSLTVPFNFGPMDLTVLARLARPVWADVSGSLGGAPGVFSIGTTAVRYAMETDNASRTVQARIRTSETPTQVTASAALPAGTDQRWLAQFDRATIDNYTVALDVGSGLGTPSSQSAGHTAFGNQTLRIGLFDSMELFGVLVDLLIARGLFTKAEMEAVA